MQLREAGLIDKWMRDGKSLMGNLVAVKSREATEAKPLELEPLRGPFLLTALALGVTVLVFAGEMAGTLCFPTDKRRGKTQKKVAWAE